MGILNRLLGQARSTRTTQAPGTAGRGRRGRAGAVTPTPAGRGLGGVAQRLLGGRRRGGL